MKLARYLLLTLLLTGCGYNLRLPYLYQDEPGQDLQSGDSNTFMFFTSDSRSDSGITLQSGADYSIDVNLLSNWTDGDIELDENGNPLGVLGFADSLMPYDFLNVFKRSGSHRWFELMLFQDNCPRESLRGFSELELDSNSGLRRYRAACVGKLSIHVNDAWGFYNNNAGYASLTITRN